jgi:hypothetical protein
MRRYRQFGGAFMGTILVAAGRELLPISRDSRVSSRKMLNVTQ